MIKPQNILESVNEFIQLLGVDPNVIITLKQNDPGQTDKLSNIFYSASLYIIDIPIPSSLPSPCTICHLVTHFLDIQSIPRRSFFELLSQFATDELEKEKLEEFCTAEGQEELYSYCNRMRRNIIEVSILVMWFFVLTTL